MKNSNINKKLYIVKGLCLFPIVLAHTPYKNIHNNYILSILSSFVSVGVFLYFIISGYYYCDTKRNFREFWNNKVTTLFIPWIIAGFINYSKQAIVNKKFEVLGLLNYIIGNPSHLYYLTILCLCYLIFWKRRKINLPIVILYVIISVISRLVTGFGSFLDGDNYLFGMSTYLNVFNYVGIFAIGIYLRNTSLLETIYSSNSFIKRIIISIASILLIAIKPFINSGIINYIYSVIIDILWSIIIITLSSLINDSNNLLTNLGKISMPIYMYHCFLTFKILANDNQISNVIYAFIRPVIIIVLLYLLLIIGYIISLENKRLNKLYKTITGVRL